MLALCLLPPFLLLGATCRKPAQLAALESGTDPFVSQALASNATVTLVIRPQSWPAARRTLKRLVETAFPAVASRVLAAPTAWAAFAEIADELAPLNDVPKLPRTLAGWDPKRPLVATIAETDPIDLAFFLRVLTRNSALESWPGLRHEIRVPATDAGLLLDSLKTVVQAFKPIVIEESRDARSQRRVLFATGQPFESKLFGALLADRDSVRIRLCTDCYHHDLGRMRNESTVDPRRREHLSDYWARLELNSAVRGAPSSAGTPAWRAFLASRDSISAYLRTDRLRDIAVLANLAQPLNVLSPGRNARDVRIDILSRDFADALESYAYLSLDSAETDDWALRLLDDDKSQLEAIGSLTTAGKRVASSTPASRAPNEPPMDPCTIRELAMGAVEDSLRGYSSNSTHAPIAAALHYLSREPFSTVSATGMGRIRFEALTNAIAVESSIRDGALTARLTVRAPWKWPPADNPCRPSELPSNPRSEQCNSRLILALAKLLDGLAKSGANAPCSPCMTEEPPSLDSKHALHPPRNIEQCPRCLEGLAETEAAVRCALEDEETREVAVRIKTALEALMFEWRGELGIGSKPKIDLPMGSSACGSDIGYQGRVDALVARNGGLLMNAELATEEERVDRYTTVEIDQNATFGAVMDALDRIPYPTCEVRFRQCWPNCHSDHLWCRGRYYAMFRNRQGGYLGLSVHRSFAVTGHGFVPIKLRVSNGRVRLECPPNGAEPYACRNAKGSLETGLSTIRSVYHFPPTTSLALFLSAPRGMRWGRIASIIDHNYCLAYHMNAFFVLDTPDREIWNQIVPRGDESD